MRPPPHFGRRSPPRTELARLTTEHRVAQALPPDDARGAAARLAGLGSNAAWQEKFFAGDIEARAEFQRLTELAAGADAAADALAGTAPATPPMFEMTYGDQLPSSAISSAVTSLREIGFSDGTIADVFAGHTVTAKEHAMTKAHQAMRHSDPEWVRRWLAGGWVEQREAMLHAAILSAGVEG
jgi:hypothetical protein